MTSIEATGPPGICWDPPASVAAVRKPLKFCTAPWPTSTSAPTTETGTKTRTRLRVRSTQKLPIVRAVPAMPRMTARATDSPMAAAVNCATTSGHLGEVAGGGLPLVGLPVGAGDEADGGIEGQQRGHSRGVGRVQREQPLQPQDEVKQEGREEPERQHRQRVAPPGPAAVGVGTEGPVNQELDGQEHPISP